MGFDGFYLNSNNGKKIRLEDLQNLKSEDVAKDLELQKFLSLFEFDSNKNGKIDSNEWSSVFNILKNQAGEDNILSESELSAFVNEKSETKGVDIKGFNFSLENIFKSFFNNLQEKVFKYTDENGKEIEDTVQYIDNKPVSLTRRRNGVVIEELQYSYTEKNENNEAGVDISIKDYNNPQLTKIITVPQVDSQGQFDETAITKISTVDENFNYKSISIENDKIYEETLSFINNNPVIIVDEYNTSNLTEYESGNILPISQTVVYSDDNSKTICYKENTTQIYAQYGDTIDSICKTFNITKSRLLELNPELRNGKLSVAQPLYINGRLSVTDERIGNRLDPAGEYAKYVNEYCSKTIIENIPTHTKVNYTLRKDYKNYYELAKDLHPDYPESELAKLEITLIALNPLMSPDKLKNGTKIINLGRKIHQIEIDMLTKLGYPFVAENYDIYNRYMNLEDEQRTQIHTIIQQYEDYDNYDLEELKDEIITKIDSNIFIEGPIICLEENNNNLPWSLHNAFKNTPIKQREVSLESFLKYFDLNSIDAEKIKNRLELYGDKIKVNNTANNFACSMQYIYNKVYDSLEIPASTVYANQSPTTQATEEEHWFIAIEGVKSDPELFIRNNLEPEAILQLILTLSGEHGINLCSQEEYNSFSEIVRNKNLTPEQKESKIQYYKDKIIREMNTFIGSDFDRVANKFRYNGLNIRTQKEIEAYDSSIQAKKLNIIANCVLNAKISQDCMNIQERLIAIDAICSSFEMAQQILRNYQDQQGVLNVGAWREFVGNNISSVIEIFDEDFESTLCFSVNDTIELLEKKKNKVREELLASIKDENSFNYCYKKITGKDYNKRVIEEFINKNEGSTVTEEEQLNFINNIAGKPYNYGGVDVGVITSAEMRVKEIQSIDAGGDIATMILTLGCSAELKCVQALSANIMKATQITKLGKTGQVLGLTLGSGVVGAEITGMYTLATGTINNLTKPAPTTAEDWQNLSYRTVEAAAWGGLGGIGNALGEVIKSTYIAHGVKGLASKNYTIPAKQLAAAERVATGFGLATEFGLDLATTLAFQKDWTPEEIAQSFIMTLAGGNAVGGLFAKNVDAATTAAYKSAQVDHIRNLPREGQIDYVKNQYIEYGLPSEISSLLAMRFVDENFVKPLKTDNQPFADKTIEVKSVETMSQRVNTDVSRKNGQVEIKVNGQGFSTNDVAEVKGEVKVSNDAEIKEVGKSDFEVEYNDYKGLAGSITIKDSQGIQLGNVNYSILEQNGRKVLKFEGLESNKSGMNIGTKLIEELVLKSIELGAEGRLIAEASPATGSGANGRPMSNLGFYYKLGFKADDPVIDAKIRECIESGKEIPLSLNIFTKISLTEEGINSIVKNNKSNLANSIDAETAKPINAPTKMSIDAIREFVANNPELKDNKWIQENIETLLDVCNDANNYGAPLVKLKEKMLHPLLKQHRLEILSTFLSDPNLYNDKQLQQGFKNLLYTYDAKSSKEMVESLKWYANLKDAEMQNTRNGLTLQMLDTNNLKDSYGYRLLINRQLSLENKKLIYEYIYKNNSFELNRNASNLIELCYNISNNDNINFLLNHFNELGSNPFFIRFFTFGENPDNVKVKISMYEYFKSINEDLQNDDILLYITSATKDNVNFIKENYNNPEWKDYLPDILYAVKDYNSNFALELMNDNEFPKELIKDILNSTYKHNVDFIRNELYKNPNVPRGEIANIARACSVTYQGKFCLELISNKDFPINQVADLLRYTYDKTNFKFAKVLYADSNIPKEDLVGITNRMNGMNIDAKKEVYKTLSNLEGFPKEQISKILIAIDDIASNKDYALKLCQEYSKMELPADKIAFLVENYGKIAPKQLQKLTRIAGASNVAKLSNSDLVIACQVADLYGKTNINEIPIEGKKEALRSLVACNEGLFDISPEMQKMFPMIPTDRDAYCSLLPSIVRSLGIETNTLTTAQTTKFNQSLTDLSGSLAKISDADFAELRITQEYSKDDFIRNVLKIVKDLPIKERQKVYDYFGFELHHNKGNQTGFSITGYPVNLNNGKKLAQITDPRTKEIVELLRPEVIKFSEQNPIRCNNPQIEKLLNEVVDILPELRAQIGKIQHSTHNFDILQHSLKVMQKVSQDPKFKELNESDQKVLMLASLLHDITKREGSIDKTHANESAFDTFFIAKKFNLSREEEIKLYTLAKHHEWLEYVNTSKSEEQLTKRLQSVAYDLQNDNLFDMALMFTHADLRAVKVDDTFHDTTIGSGRKAFDGTVRSYGESADVYAKRIQNYIQELQKSQPLLPVTKIPTASRIADAITVVRPDGSTNIKGVYKDKDGLIVIKYNEVEDWEAIGFPKGSISRGIEAQKGVNYGDAKLNEDVDTGNIKFFVHGLDYENQLAKFDAFGLVDSDVLLSISYAERPESKYRFFRTQGVLLDFDTKYIHGGGNTDAGSGCGKTIADFKENYIFGGHRESDRLYVSDLIKKATGMSDSEYIEFIKANENKPLSEIEPVELRETIVRAFASINSNTRKGAREYNEMYGSNPKEVMAVFAYSVDYTENLGNPVDFLNRTKVNPNESHSFGKVLPKSVSERTEFLRRYALEHNIPFVIFGD